MANRGAGLLGVVVTGALGVALFGAAGCGSSSRSPQSGGAGASGAPGGGGSDSGVAGNRAGASQGGSGTGGAGGSACQGADCGPGGAGGVTDDPEAVKACRDYFSAVCARVRECNAPGFGPCESPIDACPDILFAADSAWTLDAVKACTESWKTHECTALVARERPACAIVPGTRPLGAACAFDSQCAGSLCNGGVTPRFEPNCGTCAELSTLDGTCDAQRVCPIPNGCVEGACTGRGPSLDVECVGIVCEAGLRCEEGACKTRLPLDAACTGPDCALGLGCQIDVVAAPGAEPTAGTCKPLPALGSACLPTFGHVGVCAEGATCDDRPTGQCVALAKVGEACGYTKCVAGAYCPVTGYESVPAHVCRPLLNEGDDCPHEGSDLGNVACAGDLLCLCATPGCKTGKCAASQRVDQPCNGTTELCDQTLVCVAGTCVDPSEETGVTPAGSPCLRSSKLGRHQSSCQAELECLCPDAACTAPLCATPRESGETCNAQTEICRQGLACTQGTCALLGTRDIEAQSCAP